MIQQLGGRKDGREMSTQRGLVHHCTALASYLYQLEGCPTSNQKVSYEPGPELRYACGSTDPEDDDSAGGGDDAMLALEWSEVGCSDAWSVVGNWMRMFECRVWKST
jgi:hypothetical protein